MIQAIREKVGEPTILCSDDLSGCAITVASANFPNEMLHHLLRQRNIEATLAAASGFGDV